MKKREKFLLAFLISFIIIIGRYIYIKTVEAIHEGKLDKTEYQWMFKADISEITDGFDLFYNDSGYTDEHLTEEGKNFFKEQIELDKELEKEELENSELLTESQRIGMKAWDYFYGTGDYIGTSGIISHFNDYCNIAISYDVTIFRIFLLTIVIFSIISLEYKNIKQYCIDNIKYLLGVVCYLILGYGLIELHIYIISPYFYEWSSY